MLKNFRLFSFFISITGRELRASQQFPAIASDGHRPGLRKATHPRALKLCAMLLLAFMLSANTALFSQSVTFSGKDAPLPEVFAAVEKQTGYIFLYDRELLKHEGAVTFSVHDAPLKEVLGIIFKDRQLKYSIEDKIIYLFSPSSDAEANRGAVTKKQPASINIQLRDALTQDVLQGVTIRVKGADIGAISDADGHLSLPELPAGATLEFSSLGYTPFGVPLAKLHALAFDGTLTLETGRFVKYAANAYIYYWNEAASSSLDDIVVQGYGNTTRRTTTGSIGRITAKDIETQPVLDPMLTLQGRVAGLVVTPQSGYQGGPLRVEIRGRSVINSGFTSDPLYVIDGVPLTVLDIGGTLPSAGGNSAVSRGVDQMGMSMAGGQNPLFNLNTSDIESIDVLKDADATAIYGSRGANGVILITTKKGKKGDNQLNASVGQGVNFVTRKWDYLNTGQYLAMRREAFRNDGVIPTVANAGDIMLWDTAAYTDWQQYAYGGTGSYTNAQLELSGGNDQTVFRVNGGFTNTSDITAVSGINQKGSLAFSLSNHSRNQKFKMDLAANYGFSTVNQITINSINTLAPNAPPVYNKQGNLNYDGWRGGIAFPFAGLLNSYQNKSNLLTSNLSLSYNLMKGLVLRTSIGYNKTIGDQQSLQPIAAKDPLANPKPTGTAIFAKTGADNWIVEPQLEYNGFIYKGKLNVLAGGTLQHNTTNGLKDIGSGYTSDDLLLAIANAPTIQASNNFGLYRYAGIFARIGYNISDKYIINLNGRRDGSSRFGPGNQFGNFGSVGAAWVASEEQWLKKLLPAAISFIKFRGSYGLTGSDAVGDYQFLSQWGIDATTPLSSYNGVTSLVPLIQPNKDFHWQVNKKLETTMDLGFWQDRISLEATYYRDLCDNQLITLRTPQFTGFTGVTANSPAKVLNSGYEFLLNTQLIEKNNFNWTASFNISFNENKLLAYPDLENSSYRNQYAIGKSLNTVHLLKYLGVDPLTGQYTYEDHNKDGVILTSENGYPGTGTDDRYIGLNVAPKYTGGLTNQFRYKSLSLSATFYFKKQMGRNTISSTAGSARNIPLEQFDNRWQYPGQQQALYARMTNTPQQSDNLFGSSTGAYTDASFIRLQNVALAFALPSRLIRKIGMKNLSLNVMAQNLFVITKYKGIDPEIQDFSSMPPMRTVSGGLSCSF